MTSKVLGQIVARDVAGHVFDKKVTLCMSDRPVIDFGGSIAYYIDTLRSVKRLQAAGDNEQFVIDWEGKNHKGSMVYITVGQLRDLLDLAEREMEAR